MPRARTLTTCILLPFSGSPHSCCQDDVAGLFLLLTERWLWDQDKTFPLPASMAMLWHASQPSATLAVGKEHASQVTATTLSGAEWCQLGLWRLLRATKEARKRLAPLRLLQNQQQNAALKIKPWLAWRNISPSHTTLGEGDGGGDGRTQ